MSENYYESPNRNFPDIYQSHVDTIIVYLASVLFAQEFKTDPQKAYNRFLISDVNAGTNVMLGDAIQFMKQMNDNFPFVAYNVGDPTPANDYGNIVPAALPEMIYSSELDAYIRTFPMKVEMQFVAFFTDSLDAAIANKILAGESAPALSRFYTPVLFDDKEILANVDISFEFTKANLKGEFEQHLSQGRIWDVVFNLTLRYLEYIIDEVPYYGELNIKDQTGIYPTQSKVGRVDDLVIRLFKQWGTTPQQSILEAEFEIPDSLKLISTSPTNEATNISTGTEIALTFNNKVKPETVVSAITIKPYLDFKVYYNVAYTIVNIKDNSASGLAPNTKYTVIIDQTLLDENSKHLPEPYIFTFTTRN